MARPEDFQPLEPSTLTSADCFWISRSNQPPGSRDRKFSFPAWLRSMFGLTFEANKLPYVSAANIVSLTDLTPFARSMLDDADASTALSTLGVSAFGKTLLDDANAGEARATLGMTDGQLPASQTNDSASAGKVGEFISSNVPSASAVSLTSDTAADVTSITLSPGDWQVYGTVALKIAGGKPVQLLGWISTESATIPVEPNEGAFALLQADDLTASVVQALPVGQKRISVDESTVVYLGICSGFATGTAGGYGFIGARRMR